jgi:ketosteroid isomerase-like protein
MTRAILLAFALLFSASALNAQQPAVGGSPPDRARLQQVLDAWATLEPTRAAVFYAKDSSLVFYDLAPRKYQGFAAYQKGVAEGDKSLKSLTFRLGDDAVVHRSGDIAWSTALVDAEVVAADGTLTKLPLRWTTIWEKRGGRWIIVHDHASLPAPE